MNMKKMITLGGMMAAASALAVGCGTEKESQNVSPAAVQETAEVPSQATDGHNSADGAQVPDEVKNASVLKDAFQHDFTVGVAVNSASLNDKEDMEFIARNFNSITMENAMKPEGLMDGQATENSKDGRRSRQKNLTACCPPRRSRDSRYAATVSYGTTRRRSGFSPKTTSRPKVLWTKKR